MRSHLDLQSITPRPVARRLSARLLCIVARAVLAASIDGVTPTNPPLAAPDNPSASTSAQRATAPATLAWEGTARNLVASHPAMMSPISAARAYALLGVAQYGAAVASDEALGISSGDDEASLGADDGGRAQYESRRGAIGEASRVVLSALFSDAATALKAKLDSESIGPNGRTQPQFTRGKDIEMPWAPS